MQTQIEPRIFAMPKTVPTISVVIPCYGQAHFLSEAIESVLRQSRQADEIIVVNDGSPDNTSEVAKKYPVILVEKENGGLSSARNAGIKKATSQFIMCLDADDMLRPQALEEHLKIAGDNFISQCGMLYFGTQVAVFRPMGATLESMRYSNSIYCNSVFPKALWERVGGYDESETMRLGWEDYLFWYECLKVGATLRTSDYIALLYRRHGDAMTIQTTHPNLDKIKAYMKTKHPEFIF